MKKKPTYNRLSLLRVGAGWSRKDLADRLGINVQTFRAGVISPYF